MRTVCSLVVLCSIGLMGCQQKAASFELQDTTDERALTAEDIPRSALAAMVAAAAPHSLEGFELEMRDGVAYYEGEWMTTAGEREVTVASTGEIVEYGSDVTAAAVPTAVRAAADRLLEGAVEIEYEQRMFVIYEIEADMGDGEETVLLVTPTGDELLRK